MGDKSKEDLTFIFIPTSQSYLFANFLISIFSPHTVILSVVCTIFLHRIYLLNYHSPLISIILQKLNKFVQSVYVNDIFKYKLKKKISRFRIRHKKSVRQTGCKVRPSKFVHFYYYYLPQM